jgi:CRISPR-associated exonuclease Cas4
MYPEEAYIPLSALQHYLFCPRQCGLIHLHQVWSENSLTAEGRILHEKADSNKAEKRRSLKTAYSLKISSRRLGLSGQADVVEFVRAEHTVTPIEYKRGRPKSHEADRVQLCAQGLCLEEMLGLKIEKGALYYGQTRRRQEVIFDEELRRLTEKTALATHTLFDSGCLPPAKHFAGCEACSLSSLCMPRLKLDKGRNFIESLRCEP